MPLLKVDPDPFTKTEHDELDRLLQYYSPHEPRSDDNYAMLLMGIVGISNKKLNAKYSNYEDAKTLISQLPDLQKKLKTAWELKSYRSIRVLKLLHPRDLRAEFSINAIGPLEEKQLLTALTAPLKGASAIGLYEYLCVNNSTYSQARDPKYYAKFCSIVQSSGTGKTRLMLELVNVPDPNVVVLYMNLRHAKDETGFPFRDSFPARILTGAVGSTKQEETYTFRCRLFFAVIFKVVGERLENLTNEWRKALCRTDSPIRREFFEQLESTYNNDRNEMKVNSDESNLTDAHLVEAGTKLQEFYDKMCSKFVHPTGHDAPKLVIALDEAHTLHNNGLDSYHRAPVVFRTISRYSDQSPVWVLFTSTTSRVSHFSPPGHLFPSARVSEDGSLLFEPFRQTGWDIHAAKFTKVNFTEVAKTKNIIRFGRPLWFSELESGKSAVTVFNLAKHKLCGAPAYDPEAEEQALAVLGQRFAVEISFGRQDSVKLVESGVESHLRVCITTTLDRSWSYTSYPSEPFLSCAAASLLHNHDALSPSLEMLQNRVEKGMIEIGERGELVSRLLWLIAKDLFVLARSKEHFIKGPTSEDSVLANCDLVPVVDFLRFVFGDTFWDRQDCSKAKGEFEDAYVNFSHWVAMNSNIRQMQNRKLKPNQVSLQEFTERHWKRTSAVQCCHNQPKIDKMIPVYFKETERVSQIFISDKDRIKESSGEALNVWRRDIGDLDEEKSPAYIVILTDLGVETPGLSVTFRERIKPRLPRAASKSLKSRHEAPCLFIHAKGFDSSLTYPFLKHNTAFPILHALVKRHIIPIRKRMYSQFLQGQVQFSSSAELRHVRWEDWAERSPKKIIDRYGLKAASAESVFASIRADADSGSDNSDVDRMDITPD